MKIRLGCSSLSVLSFLLPFMYSVSIAESAPPQPVVLNSGWQLQDVAKVPQPGADVSASGFKTEGWYSATVPGTVLTTLVNNHVYPEPLYGENNRPEIIPESLCHTPYWYRTLIDIPRSYKGRHVWLNFEGINYSSTIWVNGVQVGETRGAFIRGIFDITSHVKPGAQPCSPCSSRPNLTPAYRTNTPCATA